MRVIARIDVKNEYAIKGIHLEGVRKVGDPNELALKYYTEGIDEIVFMDAVASLYNRNNLFKIIESVCSIYLSPTFCCINVSFMIIFVFLCRNISPSGSTHRWRMTEDTAISSNTMSGSDTVHII